MRRLPLIAASVLALAACQGSAIGEMRDAGAETSRSYQLAAFDKIEVAGPYEVKLTTGGKPGASATGGERLLDETEVTVKDGTLVIRPRKKGGVHWGWSQGKAVFTVTTAMLHGAAIAGSGGIEVDKVDGDFHGEVAGSGGIRVAAVNGGAVTMEIAGSGGIEAAGKAESVKIDIAGSGDVKAAGLAARTADIGIAGSGNVAANASDSADISIMGSGDVELTGGAKCKVSKAGSGNVRCG